MPLRDGERALHDGSFVITAKCCVFESAPLFRGRDVEGLTRRQRSRKWRITRARVMVMLLQRRGCSVCGAHDELTFHHLRDKRESVSRLISNSASLWAIQLEVRKCAILCVQCHRRIHEENEHIVLCPLQDDEVRHAAEQSAALLEEYKRLTNGFEGCTINHVAEWSAKRREEWTCET